MILLIDEYYILMSWLYYYLEVYCFKFKRNFFFKNIYPYSSIIVMLIVILIVIFV